MLPLRCRVSSGSKSSCCDADHVVQSSPPSRRVLKVAVALLATVLACVVLSASGPRLGRPMQATQTLRHMPHRGARSPALPGCGGWRSAKAVVRRVRASWPAASRSNAQVTVLVNTFHRLDLLKDFVRHFSQCAAVRRIHINWAEGLLPPDLTEEAAGNTEVTFATPLATHNDSSLNTRFLPVAGLETGAVLVLDDDIRAPCAHINRTFAVWQDTPEQLVGWFPRHSCQRYNGNMLYRLPTPRSNPEGAYSIILTKAAFMSPKWLEVYTNEMPQDVLDFVRNHKNCEDIAMQYIISNRTNMAPVFVSDVGVIDVGGVRNPANKNSSKGAISAAPHHLELRDKCTTMLHRIFGQAPSRRWDGTPDFNEQTSSTGPCFHT